MGDGDTVKGRRQEDRRPGNGQFTDHGGSVLDREKGTTMATATGKKKAKRAEPEKRHISVAADLDVLRGKLEDLYAKHVAGKVRLNREEVEFCMEVRAGRKDVAFAINEDQAEQILSNHADWVPPGATSTVTPAGIARHDPDAVPLAVPRAVVPVPIENLIIDCDSRRCVDLNRVEALAESIRQSELLQPVLVRREQVKAGSPVMWRLVAGAHRVQAYQKLGRTEIPSIVADLSDLQADLAEIDENLVRSPLSAAEECAAIARRKEIYEALHPETKRGAAGGRKKKAPNAASADKSDDRTAANLAVALRAVLDAGQQSEDWASSAEVVLDYLESRTHTPHTIDEGRQLLAEAADESAEELDAKFASNSDPEPVPTLAKSFVQDTADKTGLSARSVSAKAKLGADLPKEVVRKIRNTPIADNESELKKLAKLIKSDPEKAKVVVDGLAACEWETVTEALKGEEDSRRPRTQQTEAKAAGGQAAAKKPTAGPAGQVVPAEEEVAGQSLRRRLEDLVGEWQTTWGDCGYSTLAACILEAYAAELRERFAAA